MKRKIVVFLLLCVVTLLHEVATAQGLSIFAKQKVVIWDIIDRNDRPLDESSGQFRVLRGGSWRSVARRCCVSNRDGNTPSSRIYYNGFRVVCLP